MSEADRLTVILVIVTAVSVMAASALTAAVTARIEGYRRWRSATRQVLQLLREFTEAAKVANEETWRNPDRREEFAEGGVSERVRKTFDAFSLPQEDH
jgi:hypothetical protein